VEELRQKEEKAPVGTKKRRRKDVKQ